MIYRAESKKAMILDSADDSKNIDEFLQRQDILEVVKN